VEAPQEEEEEVGRGGKDATLDMARFKTTGAVAGEGNGEEGRGLSRAAGEASLFCATRVQPGLRKVFACMTGSGRSIRDVEAPVRAGVEPGDAPQGRSKGTRMSVLRSLAFSPQSLLKSDSFCRNCSAPLKKDGTCPECGLTAEGLEEVDLSELDDELAESPRLSVSRRTRMRRATLAKFEGTIRNVARKRINTMDAAFRRRLDEARRTFHDNNTHARLKKTQTLRKDFFKDVPLRDLLEEWKAQQDESDVFSELRRDEAQPRRNSVTGSVDGSTEEEVDIPEEQEELYNRDIDEYLSESLQRMKKNNELLEKNQKQLHLSKVKQIRDLRNNLLSEQAKLIAEVRSQSKAIIKGLRKHVHELTKTIRKKAKENDEATEDELEEIYQEMDDIAEQFAEEYTADEESETAEASPEVRKREQGRKEHAQHLLQQRYERKINVLQEELATTVSHLNDLELEQYFPKCMQWKVRLNSGDGLFIGMRDLDLELLDADIELGRGADLGTVFMSVTNICAIIGMYQFSLDGNTAKAKLLRGLLTPTVNRLDIEISGNWKLKLRFKPGSEQEDHRPKWVREDSVFDLRMTKQASGAGLVRLPDRIIRWLTTQLIPSVISNSIMLNIPVRLGKFFSHPQNYIRLKGKIHLRGEIPPRVWSAPLVAPTASGKLARRAMGLTNEEAVFLDLMMRTDLATVAGFHRKAISMNRFFKWRLQYASVPTSRLVKMLSVIESDPNVHLQFLDQEAARNGIVVDPPDGWAMQLLNRVCELAVKPVTFDVEINEIDADINVRQGIDVFTGMYVESLEHDVERAVGKRAVRAALKRVEEAKDRANAVERAMERDFASLLSDRISLDLRGMLLGGIVSGIIMATVRNVDAAIRLPENFAYTDLYGEMPVTSEGYNLTVSGQAGPEPGEYTLQASHKHKNPDDFTYPFESVPDDDGQAIVRDVQLNLFPKNAPPGTISLFADSIRASMYMCTLGEMTYPWVLSEDEGRSRAESLDETSFKSGSSVTSRDEGEGSVEKLLQRSRQIVADLWARYNTSAGRAKTLNQRIEKHKRTREHPILPRSLTDERHNLLIDIRGMRIQAIKEIGVDQKDTIRITMARSETELDPGETIASYHLRFSLTEVFEEEGFET